MRHQRLCLKVPLAFTYRTVSPGRGPVQRQVAVSVLRGYRCTRFDQRRCNVQEVAQAGKVQGGHVVRVAHVQVHLELQQLLEYG